MLTIKWIQYTLEIHQSLCCLDNQSIFRNVTSTWSSIALLLKHSFVAWEFNLLFVDPGAYLSYAWLSLWSLWEAPTLADGKKVLVRQGANLPTVRGRGLRGWQPVPSWVLDVLGALVCLWLLICSTRGMCVVVVPDVCPCRFSSANRAGEPWAVCPNTLSQMSCCQSSVALWYRKTVPCRVMLAGCDGSPPAPELLKLWLQLEKTLGHGSHSRDCFSISFLLFCLWFDGGVFLWF